ncbi:hypothetical protein BsWGS_28549 [Bradybaena similaris]
MSMLHGQPPPYTDVQALSSISVSASEASLQQSILNLATQDTASLAQNLSLSTEVQGHEDSDSFNAFKQSIYSHPLFPLLAMVFGKCEEATYSPDLASQGMEKELQAFIKHNSEISKSPLLGPNDEVNQLMIKAIQVLRIHLLEVEKVNELCKDFCARYISCLKGKLTSEQLLHVDGCDSPEPQDLSQSSQNMVSLNNALQVQQTPMVTSTVVGGSMLMPQQQQQQQPQIVSGNTVYQMVHTPQGIVAQPIQIQGPLTPLNQPVQQVIHGSTPLSQIGVSLTSPPHHQQQQQPPQQHHLQQQTQQHSDIKPNVHRLSEDEDEDRSSKQKRGILPKQATQIMKSWLFQHIVHPYPTEDEKRQIAAQTNLTLLQVNNWFINARRRILQPMLEASNPEKAKAKKPSKPGNKPQQRFWPIQPNSSVKEDKDDDDSAPKPVLTPASPRKITVPSVTAVATSAAITATSMAERVQQQIIATDTTLASQTEALMGFLPNGGFVVKVSPEGHLIPSAPMATHNPTFTLENLQALQSSGFVFTPGPTSLPFSLPLGALSPSAGAGLGLGVGHFSSLAASPMTLGALNFAPTYHTPLQFANCINTAPIDLSTMSSSTALHLGTLANSATQNTFHLGGAGQMFFGVPIQDNSGDQSLADPDESPEAGELKIDISDVRDLHDVGDG